MAKCHTLRTNNLYLNIKVLIIDVTTRKTNTKGSGHRHEGVQHTSAHNWAIAPRTITIAAARDASSALSDPITMPASDYAVSAILFSAGWDAVLAD